MKRSERKIYCRCIAVMAVYIVSAVWFYTTPTQAQADLSEKAVFTDDTLAVEKTSTEQATVAKTGQIRENKASLRKVGEVEQESQAEETESETCTTDAEEVSEVGTGTDESPVIYSVDGITPDPDLQRMLYEALDRHSISYFYEIAWVQCYQESKWQVYAVNPNNLVDSGILQYRATYFDYSRGDIFDPAVQFELYSEQMSARLNQGLSADECISRHKTSDFIGTVDWQYVAEVKQHLNSLRKVN